MVGFGRLALLSMSLLMASMGALPGEATHGESSCQDDKPLGEADVAHCNVSVPGCSGTCVPPVIKIRVQAAPSPDGLATPLVTGAVNAETVCQDLGECVGTYPLSQTAGTAHMLCEGWGISGGILLAVTRSLNAPHALSIECWLADPAS